MSAFEPVADETIFCPGGYTVEHPQTDDPGPGWWLYYEDEVIGGPFAEAQGGLDAWYQIATDYRAAEGLAALGGVTTFDPPTDDEEQP